MVTCQKQIQFMALLLVYVYLPPHVISLPQKQNIPLILWIV